MKKRCLIYKGRNILVSSQTDSKPHRTRTSSRVRCVFLYHLMYQRNGWSF